MSDSTQARLAELITLALRELEICREHLARARDWSAATPCDEWDVDALARHVAAVAWQQAEAVHRGRVGVGEAPAWLAARGDRDEVLALLDGAHRHLSLGVGIDARATVPLPFASLPAPVAASALVLEYGVHRADLERALLDAPADTLDPLVARTVAGLLPGFLPVLAEKPPPAPLTFRLRSDSSTAAITYEHDAWRAGEGDGHVCEISGTDGAISLLALGRIGVEHPALTTNDPATAALFANHVRGI